MDFNELSTIMDYVKNIFSFKDFDFIVLIFNFSIALIFLILYYDIKLKDIIKERRFMLLLVLVFFIDFLLECIFGNLMLIMPALAFFATHIIFMIKDKELFKSFDSLRNKESSDTKDNDSLKEIQFKMSKLGKDSNFNIIDILYLYDYISDYQRRKVIQELIYEDSDEMVNYLNTHPTISNEELREARAIQNLIDIKSKILTKEEALLEIIDICGKGNS